MTPSLLRRDLVCREAVELVTDYLEGAMPPRLRRKFEEHLAACDGCEEYLDQIRATIVLLGRVGPDDLDATTRDGLVALFEQVRAG